ncbi:MAG: Glycosyltransferase Gtf1 [Candidatus Latescibacteria bacterium ADurb.Bin168]|nr:MAG: Glycosyltransferase Gtf1 [Candidatus Latescibacteria bacterium ADurb.Bin168]
MNIGIVTTWFERGAAYVSRAYMEVLSGQHAVFIYARGGEAYGKGDSNWDHPNVTWAPRLDGPVIAGLNAISRLHFVRWLKKNRIDVVFFNEQQDIAIVREASGLGYTTGAYVDYYRRDTVEDFAVYDFLVCNTQRHYSIFRDHPRCLFLQWGTDVNVYRPSAARPLSSDAITFFHSAGMNPYRKGTDLLLRAFRLVEGNARLLIHTQVPLSRYGEDLTRMAGTDTRIEVVEKTVPAPGLYHLGDVYVYPSRLDGVGLSVPEALASGLPVITTDEPPMNEFVEDGVNGSLVKVSERHVRSDNYYWPESLVNVEDLARKMQAYVNNRELVAEQSPNARSSAETGFNWRDNAKDLPDWFAALPLRRRLDSVRFRQFGRWLVFDTLLYLQRPFSLPARALRKLLRVLRGRV